MRTIEEVAKRVIEVDDLITDEKINEEVAKEELSDYAYTLAVTVLQTTRAIKEFIGKQGHNRCHYYPEIFKKLAAIYGIEEPEGFYDLPTEHEFTVGCSNYRAEIYNGLTPEDNGDLL